MNFPQDPGIGLGFKPHQVTINEDHTLLLLFEELIRGLQLACLAVFSWSTVRYAFWEKNLVLFTL